MPLHDYPLHLLTLQHAFHDFFISAYLIILTLNPSPFYVSVLVLDPFYHDARVQKRLTLIGMFETIPPLDQNALLPVHVSGLHLSYASFLPSWNLEKTVQSH